MITDAVMLINGKPMMMYLIFLDMEKTFLPKNRFTPITKNNEQFDKQKRSSTKTFVDEKVGDKCSESTHEVFYFHVGAPEQAAAKLKYFTLVVAPGK